MGEVRRESQGFGRYRGGTDQTGGGHSKWGRHRCRPHSHRRVDAPTLQDLRRTFDPASVSACFRARCLASCRLRLSAGPARDLSPALAPASGFRSCRALLPPPRPKSRACPPPCTFARPRPRPFTSAELLRLWGFRRFRRRSTEARFLACPATPFRASLSEPTCLRPKPPASRLSIGAGTDVTAIFWDQNLRFLRALRPLDPVASCPEDRFKVRLNRRSDNI